MSIRLIISFLIVVLAVACQNSSNNQKVEAVSTEQIASEIKKELPVEEVKVHPGKAVYDRYCLTCHQADGSGVDNMHPPLSPGSWVEKEPAELIAIMMKGLSGKIEVNGKTYNNFMPSHAQLTEEELADVLSYVRSSFGNQLSPVTVDMVKKAKRLR